MQSATSMYGVSFKKEPRRGQVAVFDALEKHQETLNVKLPTGYGKTFVCCGVYSILRKKNKVNRLLIIFPTDAQLNQFEKNGPKDLSIAGVDGPHDVVDIRFFGVEAIKKHRSNSHQVFVITVQALDQARGMDNCGALMESGQWMICVDEYHHYGIDKAWGRAVSALPRSFLLAMSATPSRPNDDSAFGPPDISVTYREAVEEEAVKPLRGHSYNYKIDALTESGDVLSFTTKELVEEAGGDSPEKIEKFKIERKMRWSPKYVSPLVSIPIERMQHDRLTSGYKLQALVGAMCVSHAALVCDQLKSMFPELVIDWVGTGTDGRSVDENRAVLKRFCPPKSEDGGTPRPEIDVLVHVGMAGEGLDSVNVSEVVHLNNASICNRTNQINGRAARYLEGVVGNINFDASSGYAPDYVGDAIMDAMDYELPTQEEKETGEPEGEDWDLPEEPMIQIFNMELIGIDSGDLGVQRMAKTISNLEGRAGGRGYDIDELNADPNHPDWGKVIDHYRMLRAAEASEQDEKAQIAQWRDAVNNAVGSVAGRIINKHRNNGLSVPKTLAGDIKKRINQKKKSIYGPVVPDIEICRSHYTWLKSLDAEIKDGRIPTWLS